MSGYLNVKGPCGHEVDFEAACVRQDEFICPECGCWWEIRQAAPIRAKAGFLLPGERTLHVIGTKEKRGVAA